MLKKKWFIALLVGLLALGTIQVVSAYNRGEGGFGGGFGFEREQCPAPWVYEIPEEDRQQVESIRERYWEEMNRLREEIRDYRAAGDQENLRRAQEEKRELRDQMIEELKEHLPGEYESRTEGLGPGKRCGAGSGRGWQDGFNNNRDYNSNGRTMYK